MNVLDLENLELCTVLEDLNCPYSYFRQLKGFRKLKLHYV